MRAIKAPKLLHKPATHSDDEDVKTPGLVKRGSRWQFRRRIPEGVSKSLGDVSVKEARRLAAREWARTDDLLVDAERRHANRTLLDDLSKVEIAALARNYFAQQEKVATLLSDDFNDEDAEAKIEANDEDLMALGSGPADSGAQQVALLIAREAGSEAGHGDKNLYALAEAVHAAMLEYHMRLDDRLKQPPAGPPSALTRLCRSLRRALWV